MERESPWKCLLMGLVCYLPSEIPYRVSVKCLRTSWGLFTVPRKKWGRSGGTGKSQLWWVFLVVRLKMVYLIKTDKILKVYLH